MFKKRRPKSTVLEQELEQEEAYRMQLAALRVADDHGIQVAKDAPAQSSARDRLEGRAASARGGGGGGGGGAEPTRRSQRGRPLPTTPAHAQRVPALSASPPHQDRQTTGGHSRQGDVGFAAPALPSRKYNRNSTRGAAMPAMPVMGDGLYGENGQIDLHEETIDGQRSESVATERDLFGEGFGGDGFGSDSDEDADNSDYEDSDVAVPKQGDTRGGFDRAGEMPPGGIPTFLRGGGGAVGSAVTSAVPTPSMAAYPAPSSDYKEVRPVSMSLAVSRSPPGSHDTRGPTLRATSSHDDREKENIRKWLRVAMERADAQVCLTESGMMHGTYLVRKSAGGTYGLSICAGGSIFHMKVITEPNDDLELMWYVQGDKSPEREFRTIWELLQHYKKPTDRLKWHLTHCINWKFIPRGMLDM